MEVVTVDRELIHKALNGRGTLNAKQYRILGVQWPPVTGWIQRAVGRRISKADAEQLLALAPATPSSAAKRMGEQVHMGKRNQQRTEGFEEAKAWLLRFDGSCDGNGRADAVGRWAFHLQDEQSKTVATRSGKTISALVTNNVSEWQALLNGLRHVDSLGDGRPTSLRIEGDSQLVLFVLTGRWNSKKPELTAYRDECRMLLAEMGLAWTATWIPREENEFCDSLT